MQAIKNLKVKGADTLRAGTVFTSIRLIDGGGDNIESGSGHNTVVLKTMHLKKVT